MPMHNSSWALFGLATACLTALMMLLQEKMKVEGFALAFWCKVACVIVTFPFVVIYGFPSNPMFYAVLSFQALMFAVNDVILFRHLPGIGAGVISRILPMTVVLGFFLWFAVDPSSLKTYAAHPAISALIVAVLCGAAYFAMRLRRCAVSMDAVKRIWFVLLANTLGSVTCKLVTRYADVGQGPMSYTFVEAWMMIALWLVYIAVARPVTFSSLLEKAVWTRGLLIGTVMSGMVVLYVEGVYYVDNPGYVSAVSLLSTVLIMAVHKLMGKKDDSDVAAGLGIVACAALLIVLKSRL